MAQKWGNVKETETICMEPLDKREGDIIDNLISYIREASRYVKTIFESPATTRNREYMDTIIIRQGL